MRYLKNLPLLLLTLSTEVRLGLFTLCIILCLGTYILTFPAFYNDSFLIIPISLATWIFQRRGLVACLATELIVLLVYHSIRLKSVWWPFSFALSLWGGFLFLLLVGYIIVIVRGLVDATDIAEQKAVQAQRLTAIVYDQQLQLNQLKDHFIAGVSQELRAPLIVLSNSLELLKTQYEYLNPVRQSHLLTEVLEGYQELARLVDQVLNATTVSEELALSYSEATPVHKAVQKVLISFDSVDIPDSMAPLEIAEQVRLCNDSAVPE